MPRRRRIFAEWFLLFLLIVAALAVLHAILFPIIRQKRGGANKRPGVDAVRPLLFAFVCARPRATQAGR